MKTHPAHLLRTSKIVLFATLAAVASTVGCSKSRSTETSSPPAAVASRQPSVQTVAMASPSSTVSSTKPMPARPKPSATKQVSYRSRDYGISFDYPWQYAFVSAKSISRESAVAQSAGDIDSQLTLARVEVPKGFYPDTDFESGSLTVSLNQELEQDACYSSLQARNIRDVRVSTINTVPFRWTEKDEGGRGKAVKQRTYVAFANGTCYQLVSTVKTNNEGGQAREIDPDFVLRRLDAIVQTVKITGAAPEMAQPETEVTSPTTTAQN